MGLFQIDPSHTSVNFSVKHLMISKVHGGFEKVNGMFKYDPKNPEASKVEVEIDVNSINTREAQRDAHLKGADFFDVEKYPTIRFNSTRFIAKGSEMKITGDLTIHGVTKSVVLEIEGPSPEHKDPWGNTKIGLSGTTKIKRKDFGLTWNAALETGGFLVGDEINISIDVQLIKQAT